ncbi:DUF1963 domain-containing protein, partial [Salmonella enterica subsp. enterica serovar Infantis]
VFATAVPKSPTTFSQLGGHPARVQDAEYPTFAQTIMFLAQIRYEDIEKYADGMLYGFIC